MRRRSPLSLALAAALALACGRRGAGETTPPAPVKPLANELRHPAAPVLLTLPEGWRSAVEDGALTLVSPTEEVVMMVVAINAADLEESLRALNDELATIVPDAALGEVTEVEVNGLAAMVADGVGTLDGQQVQVGLMLLRANNGRIVMVVGIALADAPEATTDGAAAILRSFRPAE